MVVVEADNGVVGFGISTGGYPAAWLVMNHLNRFVKGQDACNIGMIWDQMYKASLYYGRKGIVMNAISAIDLALWDCWMSLDLPYAKKLMNASESLGAKWVEECSDPDDYWSYRDLKKAAADKNILITAGEHEAGKYSFRILIEECDVDIIQPDVGWCGGLTELIKIGNLADAYGKMVIPHGSGSYSYHYVTTKVNSPFTECLMMSPQANQVVPQYYPLIKDEPVPVNGKLKVGDEPGFGVELNRNECCTPGTTAKLTSPFFPRVQDKPKRGYLKGNEYRKAEEADFRINMHKPENGKM